MTVVWRTILERFNATSLSLQKVDTDLFSAVKLYDSLTFLLQLRDRFDETEEKAKSYVEIQEYKEATISALSDVSGSLTSPVGLHQIQN